jgi:predicted DNA-binding protein with PD1-like motif
MDRPARVLGLDPGEGGLVNSQRTQYGYALRLDPGEEIVASLTAFARQENVRGALISALGAVGETELGFFVRSTSSYIRRTLHGEHEILALTGNFSELDGEPFPHCHLIVAGEDFAAIGGHLFSAVVTVTCEAQIVVHGGAIRRIRRPDLGFNPLELPD